MIANAVSINSFSSGSTTQQSYSSGQNENIDDETNKTDAKAETQKEAEKKTETGNPNELTDEEQKKVDELKKRDAEVKSHEMAHMSAGGHYAGVASFEYQTGPNGVKYAVGGEVQIDMSEVSGDPQATITKMGIVQKAALAPAEPSAADRAVAASASMKEMEARGEVMKAAAENQNKSPGKFSERSEYLTEQDQAGKGETIDVVI